MPGCGKSGTVACMLRLLIPAPLCLQAPTYALKVSVMRAKNLLAKDPNGEWVSGRPSECLAAVPGSCAQWRT